MGWSGREELLGLAQGGVECGLICGGKGFEVDGGDGGFDGGKKVSAGLGEGGQDVGGGDALDADVLRVGAGAGGGVVGVGVDAQADALEGFGVDGVEEFDGYEDLVAGLGGGEEDDGLEIVTEGDAAAVEVDDLGHGAVGVGLELEPDAGAGDVVAVEGLGDFDGAAIPDGVFGGLAMGRDEFPRGVVECGRLAVRDVADVETPVAGRKLGEGLEGVERGERGGREILQLSLGRERLGGEGGGKKNRRGDSQAENERKDTNAHEGRVANASGSR